MQIRIHSPAGKTSLLIPAHLLAGKHVFWFPPTYWLEKQVNWFPPTYWLEKHVFYSWLTIGLTSKVLIPVLLSPSCLPFSQKLCWKNWDSFQCNCIFRLNQLWIYVGENQTLLRRNSDCWACWWWCPPSQSLKICGRPKSYADPPPHTANPRK